MFEEDINLFYEISLFHLNCQIGFLESPWFSYSDVELNDQSYHVNEEFRVLISDVYSGCSFWMVSLIANIIFEPKIILFSGYSFLLIAQILLPILIELSQILIQL